MQRSRYSVYCFELHYNWFSGADGGLDFGTMRVGEESKQTCTLKNKGRYEIAYHFMFESGIDKLPPNLHELFTVTPNRGSLIPSDRPTPVQVMYKSKNEIALKDLPILKCQVGLCVFAVANIISSNVFFYLFNLSNIFVSLCLLLYADNVFSSYLPKRLKLVIL